MSLSKEERRARQVEFLLQEARMVNAYRCASEVYRRFTAGDAPLGEIAARLLDACGGDIADAREDIEAAKEAHEWFFKLLDKEVQIQHADKQIQALRKGKK